MAAIANVVIAVLYFKGWFYANAVQELSGYENSKADIELIIGKMKEISIYIGILFIIFAVFAIFVRQMLVHYKKKGLLGYYAFLILNGIMYFGNIFYPRLWPYIIVILFIALPVYIVIVILNIVYFTKRKNMFVN